MYLRSFNSAASALQKASEWQLVLDVVRRMQRDGPQPDSITFAACILSLGKIHRWTSALDMFSYMRNRVEPGSSSCSAVLSACQMSLQWRQVLHLFFQMPKLQLEQDTISFNLCMGAAGKGQQWEVALDLLATMPLRRLQPTTISCNAAICACQLAGHWQDAAVILSSMWGGPQPDSTTFQACMPAFGRYQKWEVALEMMATMKANDQGLDHLTYSAAMCSCQNGQQWAMVIMLLSDMLSFNVEADLLCFTAALDACATSWQWQMSLGLLEQMSGVKPDVVSCNAVLEACCGSKQWQLALEVFSKMTLDMGDSKDPRNGLRPDTLSLQLISDLCIDCRQFVQAVLALKQMPFTALEFLKQLQSEEHATGRKNLHDFCVLKPVLDSPPPTIGPRHLPTRSLSANEQIV